MALRKESVTSQLKGCNVSVLQFGKKGLALVVSERAGPVWAESLE